jgi:hypothetical protein
MDNGRRVKKKEAAEKEKETEERDGQGNCSRLASLFVCLFGFDFALLLLV